MLQAQTTWDGSESNDWFNAANWSGSVVPDAADDVTIPGGMPNNPTIGAAGALANSVWVQTSAALTINATGSLTINGSRSYLSNTFGFFNQGTVSNAGNLILGSTASVGKVGLWNFSTFNNNSGGEISIDRSTNIGLDNFDGIFTNAAKITIGAAASVGFDGIVNRATFNNNSGGEISIDQSTSYGLFNSSGIFTNAAKITIGAVAGGGSVGLNNSATFNNSDGEIRIDRSSITGLNNESGTFTNAAKITIGSTASVGNNGIVNQSIFNNSGGEIRIDRSSITGLNNESGTFTNAAKITIGAGASVGIYGLSNKATFNNSGGEISIDQSTVRGLFNSSGTFTNAAKITIGAVENVGGSGIQNEATFSNNSGGEISIDRSNDRGIFNFSGTFTNAAKITIGAVASVGNEGIRNFGTFNNSTCSALVRIASNAIVFNGGTFTNAGGIIENASGNSNITTNTGVIQNLNGGTFTTGGTAAITTAGDIWTGCTSTDWAEPSNWLDGTVPTATDDATIPNVTNDPVIGAVATAKSVTVESSAVLTIASTGSLTIDGSATQGILNQGTVENNGTINIGATASVGSYGIYNQAIFNNNTGGEINIDRLTSFALYNTSGTFTNAAAITIGALASAGGYGIYNTATFNNNTGGEIKIDNIGAYGILNGSTFTNQAAITIGAVASAGVYGIHNTATFNNNTGGEIKIDRSTTIGLWNLSGTFTNQATITIGATASVGNDGIKNQATFNNSTCAALIKIVSNSIINNFGTFTNAGSIIENASGNSSITSNSGSVQNLNGGTFTITTNTGTLTTATGDIWTGCTSTDWATASNWLDGSVPTATDDATIPNQTNDPEIGAAATAKSVTVQSSAVLTIAAAGSLTIDGSATQGILNQGTVENNGTINIGATASVGSYGIYNQAIFNNNTGGEINIDRLTSFALYNTSGTFTNQAAITIGALASAGGYGIYNTATFNNNTGGEIKIDNIGAYGLLNGSTFTNQAAITIGAVASAGVYGIHNTATFNNNTGGEIKIDRTTTIGLWNLSGTFTNQATITIGATASVGNDGIKNQATFNNSTCSALINIVSNSIINNFGTFTNAGSIIENASGNSSITSNSGSVQNLNGGTFTITTNTGTLTTATGDIWTGCTSTDWATAGNWLDGTVPTATDNVTIPDVANDPVIGAVATAKSVTVQSGAVLTIASAGSLTIDGSSAGGFLNQGTTENNGTLTIGATSSVGTFGIRNEGTFNNNTGGQISIDRSTLNAIANFSTFTNVANIHIGQSVGVTGNGIVNQAAASVFNHNGGEILVDRWTAVGVYNNAVGATFNNAADITIGSATTGGNRGIYNVGNFYHTAGEISIDNTVVSGMVNFSGATFNNSSNLTIGGLASVSNYGIENGGTFNNNTGGQINIDRSTAYGLYNFSGIFTNQAAITIGAVASVGSEGIRNFGTFNNSTCTALVRIASNAIVNNTGTFTNAGGIIENASGNSSITSNTGVIQNLNGGTFTVGSGNAPITAAGDIWTGCTSTDWATASNWLDGTVPTASDDVTIPDVTNDPVILGGTAAVANSVSVNTSASLTIDDLGSLTINGSSLHGINTAGLYNEGTVANSGDITLGSTASVGQVGILNRAMFSNNSGGEISIDRSTDRGLWNESGTFTNAAKITIGAVASVGSEGLRNSATFNNNSGGEISIDRSTSIGLYNVSGTFTNAAKLTIGSVASVGVYGIDNTGTFNNNSGGEISVDQTSFAGLINASGTFTNAAKLTIGAVASVGAQGIRNFATFNNSTCTALVRIASDAIINNIGTFTNAGVIIENASGNSSISTNTGVIQNLNGGTFATGGTAAITFAGHLSACCPAANILYVNDDATGNNDGTSWTDAYTDLQSALYSPCPGITQIWVAEGTYKPTSGTDRNISFVMKNGVEILGGFPNTGDPGLGDRNPDPATNGTVLSGDINTAAATDNSYHVIFNNFTSGSPLSSTAVLDGFTITGGNANFNSELFNCGSGMCNVYASPTVTNCIFANNSASKLGGGMFNLRSTPAVSYCSFSDNSAGSEGGGMYCRETPVGLSVTHCTFSNNTAVNNGGGLNIRQSRTTAPSVTHCTFSGNSATNNTSSYGGGMYNDSTNTVIEHCTFSGNSASSSPFGGGGGLFGATDFAGARYCSFLGNSAVANGGGAYAFGSGTFSNCVFVGNTAATGGGLNTTSPTTNCSFSGNSASNGGAISVPSNFSPIKNCILWGNSSEVHTQFNAANVTYSIVQGGYTGAGNLDFDPLFVSQPPVGLGTAGDLHLQICSPAIDAGTDAGAPAADLDGNARPFDAAPNVAADFDMGAYEYQQLLPAPTATCQDITVQLDVNGSVTVPAADVNDNSTGCGALAFLINSETSLVFDCDGLGDHPVTLTVTDAFDNTADCEATITVADDDNPCCAAPEALCKSYTAVLGPGGTATVAPANVDNGSTYECGLQSSSVSPNTFNCSHVGTPQTVTLTVTDLNGGSDQCQATVTVLDQTKPTITCPPNIVNSNNADPCSAVITYDTPTATDNCGIASIERTQGPASGSTFPTGTTTVKYKATDVNGNDKNCSFTVTINACLDFSGKIVWNGDLVTGVKDATVNLTGSAASSDDSDVNGDYLVSVPVNNGNFTITPTKQINRLNGVTAADATAIQQHLVGNAVITNRYKLLAADVNHSNGITTLDASLINQCILGNAGALAAFNIFWRFIPQTYTLPNPPWATLPIPEQITLNNVNADQSGNNFVGVKIGDVTTPSANPANAPTVVSPLVWQVQDQALVADQELRVTFQAGYFENLAAYQFALHFDVEKLELTNIEPGVALPIDQENFGTYDLSDGEIRTVWSAAQGKTLNREEAVFALTFKVLRSGGSLSEALLLDKDILEAVAYTPLLQPQEVVLQFSDASVGTNHAVASKGLQLLQNRPNPFSSETVIGFVLPQACEARLRVFDAGGRLLAESVCDCAAGYQEERFDLNGLQAGIFYYELTTPFGTRTRKMTSMQ